MSHVELTDQNIPIECHECQGDHIEEGLQNMIEHIMNVHAHLYTYDEADTTARLWATHAYDLQDEWDFEHRLDRSVNADAFQNK